MMLLVSILLMCATPASQPATQPTVISFGNVKAMLAWIPKDIQPPAGQKWQPANYTIINDWCKANVTGAELTTPAVLKQSNAGKVITFDFTSDPAKANSIDAKRVTVHVESLRSDVVQVSKLVPGTSVTLNGRVTGAHIRGGIGGGQELNLTLADAEVTPKRR